VTVRDAARDDQAAADATPTPAVAKKVAPVAGKAADVDAVLAAKNSSVKPSLDNPAASDRIIDG